MFSFWLVYEPMENRRKLVVKIIMMIVVKKFIRNQLCFTSVSRFSSNLIHWQWGKITAMVQDNGNAVIACPPELCLFFPRFACTSYMLLSLFVQESCQNSNTEFTLVKTPKARRNNRCFSVRIGFPFRCIL